MIMFMPPIPLIRRNAIVRRLGVVGAVSEETAKTLREAGVLNPDGFSVITKRLLSRGVIARTQDGRYWLVNK